jgi:hypothetical protein
MAVNLAEWKAVLKAEQSIASTVAKKVVSMADLTAVTMDGYWVVVWVETTV